MEPEDEDWPALERIRSGDESGLSEIMARHKDALFRFILRSVGNPADAAELTEDAFIRVYQKAGAFKPKAKVKTWIYTIAKNLCRDHFRRCKKHRAIVSLDATRSPEDENDRHGIFPGDTRNPAMEADSSESLGEIQRAIHALPEKLKFPFIFCVLEDHSYDECAGVLRTNRKTVETRIYRARRRLRDALTDYQR